MSIKLSQVDRAALDAIEKHPGLTPNELAVHLPVKPSSVSALLSRLVTERMVNRLKVPMSPAFRYYPRAAALPPGEDSWDNTLVRHAPTRANGHAEPARGTGVLLVIEVGKNETMTLNFDQARKVYAQLAEIFGVMK
jgi:DNA-binding IclR family transcriptional regulator